MSDIVELIECRRCGQHKPPHGNEKHICDDCAKAENNRVSYYRQHNENWMELAKEADLEIWERQPGETDREWQVWLAYRDAYPSVKPSYRMVAEQLGTTINVVKKVGQRWDFQVRIQAWAKYVDELTLKQRQTEIVDMNKRHIDMATKLQDKLRVAIENIEPKLLEPKDITSLFKLAAELERKARIDDTHVEKPQVAEKGKELKEAPIEMGDIKEVIAILQSTGMLDNAKAVGIETTKRIVLKEDD